MGGRTPRIPFFPPPPRELECRSLVVFFAFATSFAYPDTLE